MLLLATVISLGARAQSYSFEDVTINNLEPMLLKGETTNILYILTYYHDYWGGPWNLKNSDYTVDITINNDPDFSVVNNNDELTITLKKTYVLKTCTLTFNAKEGGEYYGSKKIVLSFVRFDGTSPYIISSKNDLSLLAECVNAGITFEDESFKLGTDLTYNGQENNYTPIGGYYNNETKYFRGTFDGDGHTISGVNINGYSDVGIFGRLGSPAEVKNLTLSRAEITGTENIGGIVGINSGGNITNCHVTSSTIKTGTGTNIFHGGIVGKNSTNSFVRYCTCSATTITQCNEYNGAIVGKNDGTLNNNYYTGSNIGGCNGADVASNDGAIKVDNILTDAETVPSSLNGTVVFIRSFAGGKNSTIVLPFAHTPNDKDDYYTLSKVEKNTETGFWEATMKKVTTSPLNANKPYLFVHNTATEYVAFKGTAAYDASSLDDTTEGGWTFKGTYEEITWGAINDGKPRNVYGYAAQAKAADNISQGEFVKVGEYVRIRPLRCYLEYNKAPTRGLLPEEELPETIRVILGDKTDIGSISTKTGIITFDSDAWYSLDGKRFSTLPAQKGIYVNNGKKVVIK